MEALRRVRTILTAFFAAALVAATLAGASGAQAQTVTVEGVQERDFGRISLRFDRETPVAAQAENGVLVISFGLPARIVGDQVAQQMPSYVTVVRQDPDGAGMRMALTQNFRANVLPAGERVFIDLLPERWTGLPPGLPPEVVAELARRAQEAEARLAAEAVRRRDAEPRPLPVRVAELPTLARLIFDPSTPAAISERIVDDRVELRFSEPFFLEPERPLTAIPGVAEVETRVEDGATYVTIGLASGFTARGFHEERGFVVDLEPLAREAPEIDMVVAGGQGTSSASGPLAPPTIRDEAAPVPPGPAPAAGASGAVTPVETAAQNAPEAAPAAIPLAQARAFSEIRGEQYRLAFVFGDQPPAAAFAHAGVLRVVFQTTAPLLVEPAPDDVRGLAEIVEVVREGGFLTIALRSSIDAPPRLSPRADGWTLTLGGEPDAPSTPLLAHRDVDDRGATSVAVALQGASGVHWIEAPETGERIAIVTAPPGPRGMPKAQRFVEFALPQTAHGVAVVAHADDLIVRTHFSYVSVSRPQGLVLSDVASDAQSRNPLPEKPVFDRGIWQAAQRGSVRDGVRARLDAVIAAGVSDRVEARLDLARYMLANGLAPEAASILSLIAKDDPAMSGDRRLALLSGAAAIDKGRYDDARAALAAPALGVDAEGELWRAYLAALEGQSRRGLDEFRKARVMLEAYPDDLQGRMRAAIADVALVEHEFDLVERELAAIALLAPGSIQRDEVTLLRARLDMAYGRTEEALDALARVAEEGPRPLAARARLMWLERAIPDGLIPVDEAIAALETLAVSWRGDEVEIGALNLLGGLYAEEGRWRDAFMAARTANRLFPDHPLAREMHDETTRIFDEIFLGGLDGGLSRVQAIALFFDFQEFLPVGRRGDEIVRHLSDRLVELGLVDNAAELLRHQVENRLQGAARSTVAARLATLYLMEGAPLAALETLRDTRLPGLPEAISRARMLLEARALSDLSRADLALELLEGEQGPEIERLRADIYWGASRWREAGETHEAMVGDRWRDPAALTQRDRTDVLRAAIAYTLADEQLALDRLRANFYETMSQSEDARVFALATTPDVQSTAAFREIADRVTANDTLLDFLDEYRKRYPDMAVPARGASAPETQSLAPAGGSTPPA